MVEAKRTTLALFEASYASKRRASGDHTARQLSPCALPSAHDALALRAPPDRRATEAERSDREARALRRERLAGRALILAVAATSVAMAAAGAVCGRGPHSARDRRVPLSPSPPRPLTCVPPWVSQLSALRPELATAAADFVADAAERIQQPRVLLLGAARHAITMIAGALERAPRAGGGRAAIASSSINA